MQGDLASDPSVTALSVRHIPAEPFKYQAESILRYAEQFISWRFDLFQDIVRIEPSDRIDLILLQRQFTDLYRLIIYIYKGSLRPCQKGPGA